MAKYFKKSGPYPTELTWEETYPKWYVQRPSPTVEKFQKFVREYEAQERQKSDRVAGR